MLPPGVPERVAFSLFLGLALVCGAIDAFAAEELKKSTPPAPLRAIVKFRAPFAQKLETAFSSTTMDVQLSHPELRDFILRYTVKKISPLNPPAFAYKLESGLAERELVANLRGKFPLRSARPDWFAVRGAVCCAGRRENAIDPQAVQRLVRLLAARVRAAPREN